jgi:transposase
MVNRALEDLSPIFQELYSEIGQPSIAPEKLLRASLLQIFYSIRSERMLVEQLDYNLLFRWFVGFSVDDPVRHYSVFTKNRDRLLNTDTAVAFFRLICIQAEEAGMLSREHFSVDGTLIQAWASIKSFKPGDRHDDDPPSPQGRNPGVDFRGKKFKNETHASLQI